ncbi:MAG: hypothetical protein N2654_04205, partial [Deltaproteobacteria bacterium]|nr:hypothetical protein [Deltaproteobacteria bacterium]
MHDLQLSFEPKELEELNNLLERAFRSGEFEQIYGSLEETIRSLEDTKSQKAFIAKLAFEEGRLSLIHI